MITIFKSHVTVYMLRLSINYTLAIIPLAAFQERSFGTLPPGAIRHMTAAVTLTTAAGGEPKDLSSVRLFYKQDIQNVEQ